MRARLAFASATALALATSMAPAGAETAARAGDFRTSDASMLTGVNGTTAKPLISVGDTFRGYEFEALPDGIALVRGDGADRVEVLVNHETSKVPFPAARADHVNALLSSIRLNPDNARIRRGSYAIESAEGYQRFCSNFMAGAAHGFSRQTLFTVEEARDVVRRQENSWEPGLTVDSPGAEQAGVVVAYDVESDRRKPIYGMGRHNHENAVAMKGYGSPVVLSGDDTFDAPGSQLYMYTAENRRQVWRDRGDLWAFKSHVAGVNDYGDLDDGDKLGGHFIKVPRVIATGKKADGSEVKSSDFGYAPPPSAAIPDGPQWVLEQWSNEHNVFQFIRIEDMAYDRSDDRTLYFADSGEPRAIQDPATTRLMRGPSGTEGNFMNGRIFKLRLGKNPTEGATLSILADFDDGGYDNAGEVHQPDNVETTARAIYVTEDPGSHNKGETNARVWRINLKTGSRMVVAEVDQSSSPNATTPGDWETAGIIDVSSVYGKGAFLINVQAHGWDVKKADPTYEGGPTYYQEQGQMLLMRVPRP
jgi:hypothetical protein